MRRKVRKFLTLFMALVMFASLVCSREMSAFAEDVGTTEQNVFETEESVAEETDFPEETWDDQMDSVAETDEFIPQETESFVETEILEQTIRAGVYGNDASITLSGKMPEGAVAEAYPVQVEIEGQNVLAAYDITIYDAESNVFQPEAGAIRVEIADAAVTEALDGEEDISVYHMENADAQPQQIEEVNTQNQVVAFDAESFSIYVVTMPETHYTCTYDFYDGDTLVNTQILSAGETLIEPKTPNNGEHQIFDGWYTEDGVKFTGFGEFQETLASSRIIKLYARYKETYYVFYKASTAENSKVLYTQTYANGAAILTSDVPFNTGDVNKALIGWSTNPEATLPEQNLTIKGGDVTLYPVIKEAHWITYDSQGGSVVEPTYVLTGASTVAPSSPARMGYSFDGWYTDSGCTEAFQFGSTLDGNITLYAKWNPARTSYTVIFWKQQVTDNKNASDDAKKYDYEASEIRQADTGSVVSVTSADTKKGYTGFAYNSAKQTTAVVAADGSTILNVYYDRQLMTYEFYTGWNHSTKSYTFTGLYGSTLAANGYTWPSETYSWYYGNNRTTMTFLDAFLFQKDTGTSTTIKFYSQEKKEYEVCHYKEALDGTWVLANTSYSSGGTFNFTNKYIGFTVSSYRKYSSKLWDEGSWGSWRNCKEGSDVSNYQKLEVRHSRNSYTLDYSNSTAGVVKSESVKYEQNLSGYSGYVPGRPNGLEDYYEFSGWYKDRECTEAFDFNQIMPANNLVVYAKWAPKQVAVTFDLNAGESSVAPIEPQRFDAGKTADKPENPERDGYAFAGWTRNGEPFNFNTPITENTTLVAQWISNNEYTITYDSNNGMNMTMKDSASYIDGAEAKILGVPADWNAPTEYEGFICWNTAEDGTGTDYYPGDVYTMPANNVTLYAKWAEVRKTTLTYNFNGGIDAGNQNAVTINIDVPNSEYTIAGPEVSKVGYEFIGWTINEAGTGTLLKNGDKIQVDTLNPENNVLYAQWRKLIKVTVQKNVDGNMGDTSKDFSFTYTVTKPNETPVTKEFALKDGESYFITDLPEGSSVTVTENSPTTDGYKTTVTVKGETTNSSEYTGENLTEDVTVVFTNTKSVTAPTGIVRNVFPFVVMIVIAIEAIVCFFVLYLKKRIR